MANLDIKTPCIIASRPSPAHDYHLCRACLHPAFSEPVSPLVAVDVFAVDILSLARETSASGVKSLEAEELYFCEVIRGQFEGFWS